MASRRDLEHIAISIRSARHPAIPFSTDEQEKDANMMLDELVREIAKRLGQQQSFDREKFFYQSETKR